MGFLHSSSTAADMFYEIRIQILLREDPPQNQAILKYESASTPQILFIFRMRLHIEVKKQQIEQHGKVL